MLRFRIGISGALDTPGERFESLDLHVYDGERTDRRQWWRTPLVWAGSPLASRVAAVGVVVGPTVADVLPLVAQAPEGAVVVACPDKAPKALDPRVVWVQIRPETVVLVEGECHVGSTEIRVYDLAGAG